VAMDKREAKTIKALKTSENGWHVITVRHRNLGVEGPITHNNFYGMQISNQLGGRNNPLNFNVFALSDIRPEGLSDISRNNAYISSTVHQHIFQ